MSTSTSLSSRTTSSFCEELANWTCMCSSSARIAAFCWEMVLTFSVTVANFLLSLAASLSLLFEPLFWWQTTGVASSGSWIIGTLYDDASSLKHSSVFLGAISSFVEIMAVPSWRITSLWFCFWGCFPLFKDFCRVYFELLLSTLLSGLVQLFFKNVTFYSKVFCSFLWKFLDSFFFHGVLVV